MDATTDQDIPPASPEAAGGPTDPDPDLRRVTVACDATAAEGRELAAAAAIQGKARGPWLLAVGLREARKVGDEWAASRMAEAAADDSA